MPRLPWRKRVEPRPDDEDHRTAIVLEKLDYAVAHFENRARTLEQMLRDREDTQRQRGQAS